jgi:hypothetical protein
MQNKTQTNIILPIVPWTPKWLLPFRFSDQDVLCVPDHPKACCMLCKSHPPSFDHQIVYNKKYIVQHFFLITSTVFGYRVAWKHCSGLKWLSFMQDFKIWQMKFLKSSQVISFISVGLITTFLKTALILSVGFYPKFNMVDHPRKSRRCH